MIVGCGQFKEESKGETKQEVKDEEVKAEGITKESLAEFEKLYKEYNESDMGTLWFTVGKADKNYVTPEKSKELRMQTDTIKGNLISAIPEVLKETVKRYTELRDVYFNAYYENDLNTLTTSFEEEQKNCIKEIKDKVAELHIQID